MWALSPAPVPHPSSEERPLTARDDDDGFPMAAAALGLRCKRSLQVFPSISFCHFNQSSLLETAPEDQTPPRREGSWTSGRLAYKMPLCSTPQKGPPPSRHKCFDSETTERCLLWPRPWAGHQSPDVSCSASALGELSGKKSFMYKESRIDGGRGHRAGAARLWGQRQCTNPSHSEM